MDKHISSIFELDSIGIPQKIIALRIFLLVSIITLFAFALINILFYQFYELSLFESVFALVGMGLYYQTKNSKHYYIIAYLFVAMSAFTILLLILFMASDLSMLLWAAIFPIIAFYLLGRKMGIIVYVVFAMILFFALYFDWHDRIYELTSVALVNLGGALVSIGVFIYLYEHTKSNALRDAYLHSFSDELTGIGNRKMFTALLGKEKIYAQQHNKIFSLIMADIDYFKSINDQYGHVDGDGVLIEFTEILKEHIQSKDILFRWGGEEFVIILPDTKVSDALVLAEKLRLLIEQHHFKVSATLTSSFGVTEVSLDESDEESIRRLDKALYQAKELGRNRVEVL